MSLKKVLCFLFIILISNFCIAQTKTDTVKETFKSKDQYIFDYVANIPEQLLGFSITKTTPKKIGFYLDLKCSLPMYVGADDFYDDISVDEAEFVLFDYLLEVDDSWLSVNAGLTKVLSKHVVFYCGLGFSTRNRYQQYKDEFGILGDEGEYWIENKSKFKQEINAFSGLIVNIGSGWTIQFGPESQPDGFSIGFGKIIDL
ncbi:MAG: hypothetical protein KAS53_04490 [Candidatus Cloacimonetes bacterium]|nr:hypothetical protein [Candidatus Cloacimonadota bacterium]